MEMRNREALRPPGGMREQLEKDQAKLISQVKRKRNGKATEIKKRIKEIEDLVNDRGSRRKAKYLKEVLKDAMKDAFELHEELMLLLDESHKDFNDDWINDLNMNVDTCFSNIESYLISRKDESSSTRSDQKTGSMYPAESTLITKENIEKWREGIHKSTSSWVSQHEDHSQLSSEHEYAGPLHQENEDDVLIKNFSRLTVKNEKPTVAKASSEVKHKEQKKYVRRTTSLPPMRHTPTYYQEDTGYQKMNFETYNKEPSLLSLHKSDNSSHVT